MADATMGVYVFFKRYSPRVRVPSRVCRASPQAKIRTRRYRRVIEGEGYNSFVVEARSDGEFVSKAIPCLAPSHSRILRQPACTVTVKPLIHEI